MKSRLMVLATFAAACSGTAEKQVDTPLIAATPPASVAPDTTPREAPPSNSVLTEHGIGPVRIGMSIKEAADATGGAISMKPAKDTMACGYATWRGGPAGVRVMVEGGQVVRVEVDSSNVATAAGARVDDSEQKIHGFYGERVKVTPHKYTKGHYLTVTPAAAADSMYRIIFETDGGMVLRWRAGRRPQVEYVESCS